MFVTVFASEVMQKKISAAPEIQKVSPRLERTGKMSPASVKKRPSPMSVRKITPRRTMTDPGAKTNWPK